MFDLKKKNFTIKTQIFLFWKKTVFTMRKRWNRMGGRSKPPSGAEWDQFSLQHGYITHGVGGGEKWAAPNWLKSFFTDTHDYMIDDSGGPIQAVTAGRKLWFFVIFANFAIFSISQFLQFLQGIWDFRPVLQMYRGQIIYFWTWNK
jgi:hypothetical protein